MCSDLNQYRIAIGLFHGRFSNSKSISKRGPDITMYSFLLLITFIIAFLILVLSIQYMFFSFNKINTTYLFFHFLFYLDLVAMFYTNLSFLFLILLMSEDIEKNPGPKENNNLSFLHWNLNSLAVHNYEKFLALQAFNSLHKYDIICLSETFLDSTFNDQDLDFNGYKILRADHPDDVKMGGVCVYYKQSHPLRIFNIFNLNEYLVFEVQHMNQICIIVTLYRSPSQSSNEFDYFLLEFETLIDNIYNYDNNASIMILGDFNAKHSSWKPDDSESDEGIRIDAITSSYGLSQLISDPTHILGNSSSCIDLIFTNNPTMILHSGTHPSLYQNSIIICLEQSY